MTAMMKAKLNDQIVFLFRISTLLFLRLLRRGDADRALKTTNKRRCYSLFIEFLPDETLKNGRFTVRNYRMIQYVVGSQFGESLPCLIA